MPANTIISTRATYINDLIPVAICSAANPCPICWEDYTSDHLPVLLRHCGHIFGKLCVRKWFEEGANTCPLDRNTLFILTTNTEEAESWSLVRFGALPSQSGGVPTGGGRRGGIFSRTHLMTEQYLFSAGEIISINDCLTRVGCRHFVHELWHQSDRVYHQIRDQANDTDPLSVGDGTLTESIRDASPDGIEVGESAWPLLLSMTRTMLSWQRVAWEQDQEATLQREDMESWAEELWVACGSVRD
jgi:hypothetical protein